MTDDLTKDGRVSNATEMDDEQGVQSVDSPTRGSNAGGVADDHPIEKGGANQTPLEDEAETFPRDYVVKLRDENAKYRQRAQDRDEVAAQLHTALVAATGRLADPSDLAFDEDHIVDPNNMAAAIDELLQSKPHLASRKPTGDIGQGVSGASDTFSLLSALRTNAS